MERLLNILEGFGVWALWGIVIAYLLWQDWKRHT